MLGIHPRSLCVFCLAIELPIHFHFFASNNAGCNQAIGEAMGRFPSSVRDRLRVLQGPKGKKWDASEEKRLTEVVLRFTGRDRTELIQADVPWEAVAREMTPRAPHQVTLVTPATCIHRLVNSYLINRLIHTMFRTIRTRVLAHLCACSCAHNHVQATRSLFSPP